MLLFVFVVLLTVIRRRAVTFTAFLLRKTLVKDPGEEFILEALLHQSQNFSAPPHIDQMKSRF